MLRPYFALKFDYGNYCVVVGIVNSVARVVFDYSRLDNFYFIRREDIVDFGLFITRSESVKSSAKASRSIHYFSRRASRHHFYFTTTWQGVKVARKKEYFVMRANIRKHLLRRENSGKTAYVVCMHVVKINGRVAIFGL